MKFKQIAILFYTALSLCSCNSKSGEDRDRDSSGMMDSGMMNHRDTLDRGLDTSVIDTPNTELQRTNREERSH